MTEHRYLSAERYKALEQRKDPLTNKQMEAVVDHIRYSGQHAMEFMFSNNLGPALI